MMESERGFLFAELSGASPHADWRRASYQREGWQPLDRARRIEAIHDR